MVFSSLILIISVPVANLRNGGKWWRETTSVSVNLPNRQMCGQRIIVTVGYSKIALSQAVSGESKVNEYKLYSGHFGNMFQKP